MVPLSDVPQRSEPDKPILQTAGTTSGTSLGSHLPPNVMFIAVMGATGSGKTTFVNLASGSELRVGEGLQSCTTDVEVSTPFQLDGRLIVLIDTPGFDDTNKSDVDILTMIGAFLSSKYKNGTLLSGIIWLHRISDVRMSGISKRNFHLFRKLCGEGSLKNVAIVTNMWSEANREREKAREKELASEDLFFKPAIDKQAQLLRHHNTVQSAYSVLRGLMRNRPVALRIQTELVDEGKKMNETAAGAELNRELIEEERKHKEELRKLREEMDEAVKARDEETKQELADAYERMQAQMEKIQEDSANLRSRHEEERERMDRRIKEMAESYRIELEKLKAQRDEEVRELERRLASQETSMAEKAEIHKKLEDIQRELEARRWRCFIM